ncbi:hypothetical protein [uncultured Jannaschia sp.]|uniref:hypothetical protein n=1 Tax=uncultured Jannaschia sp. TaxID=293347 RepID=UPI00262849D6|nr:hypothetical protein [uncultured Jannaschia sp.]
MSTESPWGRSAEATSVPRVRQQRGPAVQVWLIHRDGRPDFYETIFDFATFVEASRTAEPSLLVWSGRDDVDRTGLRQTLRRIVTAEIDAARAQLNDGGREAEAEARTGMGLVLTLAAQGALLAMRATPAGLATSALLGVAALVLGRDRHAPGPHDPARLEAEIERVKAATDRALDRLDLKIHPELSGGEGDSDAWPLPQAVRDVKETPCSARS